ncbi:YdcF family protein [Bifidobacterium tibiigranuli]|uniref:YdcF family protein n=1 Tax=Bifidobacterium tibiigranuli TaxID=2172043 RepID=UPI0026EE14DC|nr:YdcF family protein [Bifidobacterium tibiigranuli]MCI1649521.1 YdcF family protein [Bifidobacterium tibiigranuli]MCI2185019.1 YdcF family protein [Bifidobacterium tibiigranuli]MCI2203416.1 YdcF family protein [Bifidobacterium tibiigranuli]
MSLSPWAIAVLFVPAAVFGTVFLVSFIKEPRQFRNAIWFMLLVMSLIGAGLVVSQQVWLVVLAIAVVGLAPFLVIVFLVVNSVSVIRHEGLSLATMLPGALALAVVAFLALYAWDSGRGPRWLASLIGLVLLEGLWFFFSFAALLAYSWLYRIMPRNRRYDYIIIHGAGLSGDKPTPLLRGRIDKAVELWERQQRYGVLIVSGGQGSDEVVSEAAAMRAYLTEERHIPEESILMEDRSTTTMENLRFSKDIMDGRSGAGPHAYRAALVTSDYHVFRASEYAHQIGLKADGVGSRTSGYYWPTAFIREFVAISRAHIWPYVVIAILWLIGFIGFDVIVPWLTSRL